MGRFVLTVRAQGVSFLLADNEGKILMNSALYAGMDTAKKGIRSLAAVAPEAPVIDKSIGEHGPNPKFELSGGEDGFFFLLRSANGKPIFRSPDYADREKCLLAIEALRKGVRDATETVYEREAGYSPVRTRRSLPVWTKRWWPKLSRRGKKPPPRPKRPRPYRKNRRAVR